MLKDYPEQRFGIQLKFIFVQSREDAVFIVATTSSCKDALGGQGRTSTSLQARRDARSLHDFAGHVKGL